MRKTKVAIVLFVLDLYSGNTAWTLDLWPWRPVGQVTLMDQDTEWLYQLLAEVQLEKFYLRVRDGLNITRIEHFAYVKESDLEQIGISKPGEPDRPLWSSLLK